MRKWSPTVALDADRSSVYQIVVPAAYRQHVLSVASESQWSGYLAVTKTNQLILKHFFWLGLKSDVTKYCRSCHVCQLAGKPNQTIPSAPLHPISVVSEPFERVIVDCVGPRTKNGNQYLLTYLVFIYFTYQSLKSMLRKYCLATEKCWGEGVPFMLFAACDAIQGGPLDSALPSLFLDIRLVAH